MIIRKYGDRPQVFVPDIGEVIQGRRTRGDRFIRAVVTGARRKRDGSIELTVHWLEDCPEAGVKEPHPIVAGEKGWITFPPADMWLFVRQTEAPA